MKVLGVLGNYFRPDREGAPSPFGAYYLNKDYVDSFSEMNVLPIQIPYLSDRDRMLQFIDLLDGLLLTGGFDIIKGERIKIKGYLEDFALSRKEADDLIMTARDKIYKN